jgi:hypothetical protein
MNNPPTRTKGRQYSAENQKKQALLGLTVSFLRKQKATATGYRRRKTLKVEIFLIT